MATTLNPKAAPFHPPSHTTPPPPPPPPYLGIHPTPPYLDLPSLLLPPVPPPLLYLPSYTPLPAKLIRHPPSSPAKCTEAATHHLPRPAWRSFRLSGCSGERGAAASDCSGDTKRVWLPRRPRDRSLVFPSVSPKRVSHLPDDEKTKKKKQGEVTTLMIRNIPNKYSRQMLMDLLDEHCREQNAKQLQARGDRSHDDDDEALPVSQYDFLYLPMDFRHKGNLGYAFVNFTSEEAAKRLRESMQGRKWEAIQSRKICCVCTARIQGKESLVENFSGSRFHCDSEEFLPVVFDPPRDGCAQPRPVSVGHRVHA